MADSRLTLAQSIGPRFFQGQRDAAFAIFQQVMDQRGRDAPVIRELIVQLCRIGGAIRTLERLLGEYRALTGAGGADDADLLSATIFANKILGRWQAAAAAQRRWLGCKPGGACLNDFLNLASLLYRGGDREDAGRITVSAQALAAAAPVPPRSLVPLGHADAVARAIGEMSIQFDLFHKAVRLGWLDGTFRNHGAFILDDGPVCNRVLLDYWRGKLPVHTRSALPPNIEVVEAGAHNLQCLVVPGLGGVIRDVAFPLVQAAWCDRGLEPSLVLTRAHREQSRRALAGVGIGEDDWFVALHVREAGWAGEGADGANAYRCAIIADYLPMIAAITARGGRVVRLGDATMTPLPPLPGVFDYAVSPLKSDLMDVFLCAGARFVVGCQSGLHIVATSFGTPVVITNYLAAEGYMIGPDDMIIHKTVYSERLGRRLTIRECCSAPLIGHSYRYFFDDNGLTPIANSSDEITDVCLQMLDHLEGREIYDSEEHALWQRYRDHANYAGYRFGNPLGRRFLRNIRDLMPDGPIDNRRP